MVSAIHYLDDRFLDEEDKQMCLIILKSLAKGQSVSIKRTDEVHPKGTSAQDQGITLTPQDKENLKQIVDMF